MSGADAPRGLRVPPHSVEAEQSVLGSVLIDSRAFEAAADLLSAEAFYLADHRVIWSACSELALAGQAVDVITVFERLRAAGRHEGVGGLAYLNELAMSVASAGHVRQYAQIVRQHARARGLIAALDGLVRDAWEASAKLDALDALLDRAQQRLLELQQGLLSDEPRLIGDLMPAWIDALEQRANGKTDAVSTGLHDVDRVLSGGLRPGELVVIGARPSMGKTALMLTICRAVAGQVPVLACSLEDSDMMMLARLVAAEGRVNLADIRTPRPDNDRMWTGVADASDTLAGLPLYIDDRPGLALRDIRRKAMQVRRRAGGLGMIVVDYLQLMEGDGETRAYELAGIARGLKRLAKELGCTVLLLSQLSREADKTPGAPPRLDHLAESGGVEQAADNIGLLWRKGRASRKEEDKHHAQVEWAKVKNGATRTVQLHFDGATQRFVDAYLEGEA